MIKIAAPIIAPVFNVIYNESINTGIVPDILKISCVAPIFKSGIETDPNNYRPISTLSPFTKVLERLYKNYFFKSIKSYMIINSASCVDMLLCALVIIAIFSINKAQFVGSNSIGIMINDPSVIVHTREMFMYSLLWTHCYGILGQTLACGIESIE